MKSKISDERYFSEEVLSELADGLHPKYCGYDEIETALTGGEEE